MGSKEGNTLEKITSYLAIGNEKLLQQYKGKENFQKLLTIFARQFDELEDSLFQLYLLRWLSSATGQQLDNLGYNLSTTRQGLNDDDYRQILYGRIGQYNSDGSINDIINIVKLMTNADFVVLTELFPAKIILNIIGINLVLSEDFLKETINGSVAGGVGIDITVNENLPAFMFADLNNPNIISDVSGFADLNDVNSGGYLGRLIS